MQVMDAKTPTGTGEILNFCLHLVLEEGAMEEEHVCPLCKTPGSSGFWPTWSSTWTTTPKTTSARLRAGLWSSMGTQGVLTARVLR